MNPKPGEVWLADLGLAAKFRPVIIVSRYDADPPRVLATYIPLTTQNRSTRYEVELPNLNFLDKKSVANVQGISSIPVARLKRKIGKIPKTVMIEIKKAISFGLDIDYK